MRLVSPKCRTIFNGLHGVISQKRECLFVCFLFVDTVTVSETVVSNVRMDNELEKIFMEVVVAEFWYHPYRCLDGLRKPVKDI
jgi:hypothetical protein